MLRKLLLWYVSVLLVAAILSFSGGFLAQSLVASSGVTETSFHTGAVLLGEARADYYWMYLLLSAVVIVGVIALAGRLPGLIKK